MNRKLLGIPLWVFAFVGVSAVLSVILVMPRPTGQASRAALPVPAAAVSGEQAARNAVETFPATVASVPAAHPVPGTASASLSSAAVRTTPSAVRATAVAVIVPMSRLCPPGIQHRMPTTWMAHETCLNQVQGRLWYGFRPNMHCPLSRIPVDCAIEDAVTVAWNSRHTAATVTVQWSRVVRFDAAGNIVRSVPSGIPHGTNYRLVKLTRDTVRLSISGIYPMLPELCVWGSPAALNSVCGA